MVTLSSAEAELTGIVKGTSEAIGLRSYAYDLGMNAEVAIHADAAAAIGICRRSGKGRVRHLAVGQLWIQAKVKSGEVKLFKVEGSRNPADILTKNVPHDLLFQHLQRLPLRWSSERAQSAPAIAAP